MSNGKVTQTEVEVEVEGTTQLQHATSAVDVLAVAIQALRDRGISNPEQFASLGAEPILGTCRWFDAQAGRVGAGVLVAELRAGGKPGWQPTPKLTPLEREAEYGRQVVAWLRQNFPEFDRPRWGPHPAAVAAVIRLHHRDGKGSLTKRKHGKEIRAAVKAWEREEQAG